MYYVYFKPQFVVSCLALDTTKVAAAKAQFFARLYLNSCKVPQKIGSQGIYLKNIAVAFNFVFISNKF
jgi:hypothetical protein